MAGSLFTEYVLMMEIRVSFFKKDIRTLGSFWNVEVLLFFHLRLVCGKSLQRRR